MASTRNNNKPNDYCLQQRGYNESRNYLDYQFDLNLNLFLH